MHVVETETGTTETSVAYEPLDNNNNNHSLKLFRLSYFYVTN